MLGEKHFASRTREPLDAWVHTPLPTCFVSYKDFSSEDGESVTIVEFQSMEDNLRWRNHHEHVATQAFGRDSVFLEYNIQVCERIRGSRFP